MTTHKILSSEEASKQIAELLETTHYYPKPAFELDEYGFPIVEPEPDDPDDDFGEDPVEKHPRTSAATVPPR
jgi:hypothetical protein